VFGEDKTRVKVDLGNTARLACTVLNLGSRAISWKRGDSLLFLNSVPGIQDPRYSVEMTAEGSTLTITLVKVEDAGQLTCQVASKPPIEKTFNIEIKAPPNVEILNKPRSGELLVEEGSKLKLRCKGEGDPQPSLTWKRLNSGLPPSVLRPHSDTLVFPGLSGSDAGTYQCVADNGFGHPALDSVSILVKHKPLIYVQEEFRMDKETGQMEALALICSVQAYPRAETKWRRSDSEMPGARVSHTQEDGKHILHIKRPRQSDVGVYTCEASNEMGKMFAVLNVPDHADLPDLVSEGEDGVTATGSEMKQRKVKSGAVMIRSETVIFIFMALAVHLRTRY